MKLRAAFLFLVLTALPSVALCAQRIIPPNSTMTVKLLAPLSTKTNKAGDKISAQVVSPAAFQGDFVGGEVRKVKNGGKIHGRSVLNFTFDTLYHQGKAIPIASSVLSVMNSRGQENVDEEGEVVKRKNNIGKLAIGSAGGGLLGGILGGWKGAAIGAAVGLAASAVLVETMAKGPSIEFAPGSEFVLSVKQRRGKVESAASPLPPPAPVVAQAPVIASITPIASPKDTIIIRGSGFGENPQTVALGDGSVDTVAGSTAPWLSIIQNLQTGPNGAIESRGWGAGTIRGADRNQIGVNLAKWTDTEIVLDGFGSALGPGRTWNMQPGDTLTFLICGPNNHCQLDYAASAATPRLGGASDTVRVQAGATTPIGEQGVTSTSECTGPGTQTVSNNTHGTIQIQGGAGSFAGLSPTEKEISVAAGASIKGTVQLSVVNQGASFAVAPLIWTSSWGDPANSWRLIQGWVRDGQNNFTVPIQVTAPQTPGTYHILFAFQLETNGVNVASATNWAKGQPVWNDGNDVAEFSAQQIAEAQQFGCTTDRWLMQTGSQWLFIPADAITINVGRAVAAASQPFSVLHSFSDSENAAGVSGLIQGRDGNFYGTSSPYGPSGEPGAVFRMDPSGNVAILHYFSGPDGGFANATSLVQGPDGNFYGTAQQGGALFVGFSNLGDGTVFKMDAHGNVSVLHSFDGSDGAGPDAALFLAKDGNFYGTTQYGGRGSCGASGDPAGCGTVFKIDSAGNITVLHSFSGPDGAFPQAALIQGSDGDFYGTTSGGGTGHCSAPNPNYPPGCGTVFRMDAAGNVTVLHSFNGTDGGSPSALVQASNGDFYGTTGAGGSIGGIFKVSSSGHFVLLHSFSGPDGSGPVGPLVQGRDGFLYGSTFGGGTSGDGTIFRADMSGNVTVLHNFSGAEGEGPGSLLEGNDGNLYGTTSGGGSAGPGVIFEFRLPAGPTAAMTHPFQPSRTAPAGAQQPTALVRALVRDGQTSIELPPGRFYIYGLVTGGGARSSGFAIQPYAQALNAAGMVSAALAYGANASNTFTTSTGYHVIGGASVNGSWTGVRPYYGSNSQQGASEASVAFPIATNSLVVVVGLASSQQRVSLNGIPGLVVDASSSGPGATDGMVIAHAYLSPGNYTVIEHSAALAAGQDPAHMTDLVGVFVFEQ